MAAHIDLWVRIQNLPDCEILRVIFNIILWLTTIQGIAALDRLATLDLPLTLVSTHNIYSVYLLGYY